MNDLEKALNALSDKERSIIDRYASEYMEGIKDSAFRKAWMDLRLTDDDKQRQFMESDEFTDCLHDYQRDSAYWQALYQRKREAESATEHKGYMALTNLYGRVA
ncbi:hypothetical protein [Yersinia pseudotuberculosis]|uniref:hypothetical protein n=1 Tax=Yersinia pseudotuberculosis TaxID=633 RepID=UPI00094ABB38|nr:hypothetical protein [Yersinia pseudotuberculosis]